VDRRGTPRTRQHREQWRSAKTVHPRKALRAYGGRLDAEHSALGGRASQRCGTHHDIFQLRPRDFTRQLAKIVGLILRIRARTAGKENVRRVTRANSRGHAVRASSDEYQGAEVASVMADRTEVVIRCLVSARIVPSLPGASGHCRLKP